MGAEPVNGPAPTLVTRLDGPAPEAQVARDMVRRALPLIPLLLLVDALGWGVPGVCAGAYAIVIVLANLSLSAALLAYAARISLALVMAAAMFGFLVRLGLIFLAVLAVKDASWINLWALGLTLIVTHLGLLFWEMRYVSLSLAHPGVKPASRKTPASLAADQR
jgi:hypothetical protein